MPSKRLLSLLPLLIFPFLSACSTAPKVEYRLVPLSGAKQTMTPKQVLIVCLEDANVAGRSADIRDKDLRDMGGFLPTLIAGRNKRKAEDSALVACLARAGYEIKEVAKAPLVQPGAEYKRPRLHSSRIENGILICNYGTLSNLITWRAQAKAVRVCPPEY